MSSSNMILNICPHKTTPVTDLWVPWGWQGFWDERPCCRESEKWTCNANALSNHILPDFLNKQQQLLKIYLPPPFEAVHLGQWESLQEKSVSEISQAKFSVAAAPTNRQVELQALWWTVLSEIKWRWLWLFELTGIYIWEGTLMV